jgi:hypothetical protein
MIAPRKGPRAGSRARRALAQLQEQGGQASAVDWMKSVRWDGTMSEFNREVVAPLARFGLLLQRGPLLTLTDPALVFLGLADPVPESKPVLTPATYVPPMQPLSSKHMARVAVMRPGALDYQKIPSRMGDLLIPHGAKAVA